MTPKDRARNALLNQLEYDTTGQMKDAKLDFDQIVQYSIAMSLKSISDKLGGT